MTGLDIPSFVPTESRNESPSKPINNSEIREIYDNLDISRKREYVIDCFNRSVEARGTTLQAIITPNSGASEQLGNNSFDPEVKKEGVQFYYVNNSRYGETLILMRLNNGDTASENSVYALKARVAVDGKPIIDSDSLLGVFNQEQLNEALNSRTVDKSNELSRKYGDAAPNVFLHYGVLRGDIPLVEYHSQFSKIHGGKTPSDYYQERNSHQSSRGQESQRRNVGSAEFERLTNRTREAINIRGQQAESVITSAEQTLQQQSQNVAEGIIRGLQSDIAELRNAMSQIGFDRILENINAAIDTAIRNSSEDLKAQIRELTARISQMESNQGTPQIDVRIDISQDPTSGEATPQAGGMENGTPTVEPIEGAQPPIDENTGVTPEPILEEASTIQEKVVEAPAETEQGDLEEERGTEAEIQEMDSLVEKISRLANIDFNDNAQREQLLGDIMDTTDRIEKGNSRYQQVRLNRLLTRISQLQRQLNQEADSIEDSQVRSVMRHMVRLSDPLLTQEERQTEQNSMGDEVPYINERGSEEQMRQVDELFNRFRQGFNLDENAGN
ncbi:MAG: hypothetical protein WC243_01720 [Patescibacteria group bacterium]|jgi:hypothetical protein